MRRKELGVVTQPSRTRAPKRHGSAGTFSQGPTEWQTKLGHLLTNASTHNVVALVGVGHRLRCDDYVGSFIAKRLSKSAYSKSRKGIETYDAESDVESIIVKLERLKPKHVVFIDACELGAKPGEVRLVSVIETNYAFFTTHGLPLRLLAERLLPDSHVWVLAIQTKNSDFGETLSPQVRSTALAIEDFMKRIIMGGA